MANPQVSGQDLLDALKINLGSMANAFTTDQSLYFLNLGVAEVWSVVRAMELDYFTDSSQDTQTSQDDFFLDLSTTLREYALPKNCREVRGIEVVTQNYADRVFEYRIFDDREFQAARRDATALGINSGSGRYFYTIFGTQLMLAQFPEAVMQAKIWFIKSIDDIDVSAIPEILHPFSKKIVDYATKRAVLSMQNIEMTAAWKMEWEGSIRTLALTVGSRDTGNAIFISDFV